MTPERFIENCGQPSSDTEPIVLDVKASTVTVARASTESAGKGVAIDRSKECRRSQSPYLVKLFFQPAGWYGEPQVWILTLQLLCCILGGHKEVFFLLRKCTPDVT
jgi:hypothetical protein